MGDSQEQCDAYSRHIIVHNVSNIIIVQYVVQSVPVNPVGQLGTVGELHPESSTIKPPRPPPEHASGGLEPEPPPAGFCADCYEAHG